MPPSSPGQRGDLLTVAIRGHFATRMRALSEAQFWGHTTYFPWTAPLGKISGAEPADSKRSTTAEGSGFRLRGRRSSASADEGVAAKECFQPS